MQEQFEVLTAVGAELSPRILVRGRVWPARGGDRRSQRQPCRVVSTHRLAVPRGARDVRPGRCLRGADGAVYTVLAPSWRRGAPDESRWELQRVRCPADDITARLLARLG
ncbi:MAG: hypothetical protein IT204_23555 [Fimbriimonadaceae bacterium]|nr:hypothetical protein [Fimbriimonadaceae bacterium]